MKIILWLSMQRSVLEICIGMLNSQEESKEYSISYSKLGSVDHQNRSRVFFQHLISKNRDYEFHGPIRNFKWELSNFLIEYLQFWSNYYQKLYSKTGRESFNFVTINDKKLDFPFTNEKFKNPIMSLKIIKALGSNFLSNEEFKK